MADLFQALALRSGRIELERPQAFLAGHRDVAHDQHRADDVLFFLQLRDVGSDDVGIAVFQLQQEIEACGPATACRSPRAR